MIEIGKDLLIPIFIALITLFVPEILLRYSNNHEKNQYIRVLKTRSPFIEAFFSKRDEYKQKTRKITILYFIFGFITGAYIEKYTIISICFSFLDHISELDFVGGNFSFINNPSEFNSILLLDSFSNIPIIIILIIYLGWNKWIYSKNHLKPQFTDSLSIKKVSEFIYGFYWFLIGAMLGIIFLKYLILILSLQSSLLVNSNIPHNEGLIFSIYRRPNINTQVFRFCVITYILFIIISTYLIISFRESIKIFSSEFLKSITDFYQYDFPYIEIKTQMGEVNGQLIDIQNKNLITLCENNELKIVKWDKIEIMEVKSINKNR